MFRVHLWIKLYFLMPNDYCLFIILFNVLGVQKIIVSSTSLKGSREALRLSRIYPGTLYATAGNPVYIIKFIIDQVICDRQILL